MNDQDKTKEELIIELQELRHENDSLNATLVKDIIMHKQAKEVLERFKNALEASSDAVGMSTSEGKHHYQNKAFDELFGDIGNDPPISLYVDVKEGRKVFETIMGGDTWIGEIKMNGKGKKVLDILLRAYPTKDENGKVTSLVGVHTDITKRKQAEKELIKAKEKAEQNEEKFRNIFEKSNDAILIIENGIFTDCNIATVEMLEYKTKEQFLNVHPSILSPEKQPNGRNSNEKAEEMMNLALVNGTHRFEWMHSKRSSEIFPVEVLLTAISNETGNKVIHCVWRDITERKLIEKELIIAKERAEENDRLKSAFLANMSHEIRTPMNGILGFAEILKGPNLTGEMQQKYLSIIEKSGVRMLNIINDIVDISKIEAGLMKLDIKESNINEQIEYIYTFFMPEVEAKGINFFFKKTLTFKEATILTDREKVFAILTNLVKNAIKYTEKGSIEFGYLSIGSPTKIMELKFYVKDTGIGIPKDRHEAIFERFIQADIIDEMARQGAGLGLSITKTYIEMLGGKIWVESEEDVGSTFYFTLPYHKEKKEKIGIKNVLTYDKADRHIGHLKILIADDDEISERLISINIKEFCKTVIKVRTGVEAVEACRNNSDIDLILMDIQMPSMNGYEATRQIRQFNKDIIIIAQTAYGLTGDREKSILAGCNDYIAKPIKIDVLLALLQKYFKK